ncbi:MAG: TerC family protein [Bdellovibrionota bacterium]
MSEGYLGFLVGLVILVVLTIDLGLFNRHTHELSLKKAFWWSVFWIAFALSFNVVICFVIGPIPAVEFLTGYLVEKSLSVDNLFVFLMIFTYFKVEAAHQRKVLLWGIIGAVVMRGLLIAVGIRLIEHFHWLTYVLGGFLVITGIRTAFKHDETMELEHKPLLRFLRRFLPLTSGYVDDKFVVRRNRRTLFTPLLIVLIMIETTDLVFALDSIPAILAITQDRFVLYTSNLFAILGLRALYFVLAGLMQTLRFLNYGVSGILAFVGTKMFVSYWYDIGELATLSVISAILALSTILSLAFPSKQDEFLPAEPTE